MPKIKLEEDQIIGVLAERRKEDGRRRISLSQDERAVLQRRQLAEAAAALFLFDEIGTGKDEILLRDAGRLVVQESIGVGAEQ